MHRCDFDLSFLFVSVWIIRKEYVYKKENMTNKELVMFLIPSLAGIIEYVVLKYYSGNL